jgi:hypothetical protein
MRRVAVIILNWNGWRDSVAAVESVARQRLRATWTIVVDNASTDGSEAGMTPCLERVSLPFASTGVAFFSFVHVAT